LAANATVATTAVAAAVVVARMVFNMEDLLCRCAPASAEAVQEPTGGGAEEFQENVSRLREGA
jgi:hypothetical protein